MAGAEKSVDLQIGRIEDGLDGRDDRDVVAEQREVAHAHRFCMQHGHRSARHRGLEAQPEEHHLLLGILLRQLQRVERGIDGAHIGAFGLGLQQAFLRPGHAHRVAEGRHDHLRMLGNRHAVVDAAHRQHAHRAAGAVNELDGGWQQVLQAVAEDGVRVPAADFHHLQGTRGAAGERVGQQRHLGHQRLGQLGIAKFVCVFHRVIFPGPRSSARRV
jgi:hypothetical protein